jgi:hypothetical protein
MPASDTYFPIRREGPRATEISVALPHALAVLADFLIMLFVMT